VISILNWNGWEDTLKCLESVRQLNYPNYLMVVADNGSKDGSPEKIKAWAKVNFGPGQAIADYTREAALAGGIPETEKVLDEAGCPGRMVLIRNENNLGFTGGNNVTIHYALTRSYAPGYVMLLNNDAKVLPDVLTKLVSAAQRSGAGIAGSMVMDVSGLRTEHPGFVSLWGVLFKPFAKLYTPYPDADAEFWEAPVANGAGMLISTKTLGDVFQLRSEYLNSSYFMYDDELEFVFHARSLGYRTVVVPNARVLHECRKSSNSTILAYYMYRNTICLSMIALSPTWKAAFDALTLAALPIRLLKLVAAGRLELARAVYEGQRDGFLGVMGKWRRHDEVVRFGNQAWRLRAQQLQ